MSGRYIDNGRKERRMTDIMQYTDHCGIANPHLSLTTSVQVQFDVSFKNKKQKKKGTDAVQKVKQQIENLLEQQRKSIRRTASLAEINESTINDLNEQLFIEKQHLRSVLERTNWEASNLKNRLEQAHLEIEALRKAFHAVKSENDELKNRIKNLLDQMENDTNQKEDLRNRNASLKTSLERLEISNIRLMVSSPVNYDDTTFRVANYMVKKDEKWTSKQNIRFTENTLIELNAESRERERRNREENVNLEMNGHVKVEENQRCVSEIPEKVRTRRFRNKREKKRLKKLEAIKQKTNNVSEQQNEIDKNDNMEMNGNVTIEENPRFVSEIPEEVLSRRTLEKNSVVNIAAEKVVMIETSYSIERTVNSTYSNDDSDNDEQQDIDDVSNTNGSIYHNVTCILKTKNKSQSLFVFAFLVLSFLTSFIYYTLASNIES